MKNNLALNTIALAFFLSLGACDYNKLPEPEPPEFCDTADVTYNNQIKAIVDNSCAYSGCHDGAGGIGRPGCSLVHLHTFGEWHPFHFFL